jgi:hypothetical protein
LDENYRPDVRGRVFTVRECSKNRVHVDAGVRPRGRHSTSVRTHPAVRMDAEAKKKNCFFFFFFLVGVAVLKREKKISVFNPQDTQDP